MEIFTTGFTKKSAAEFFDNLRAAGIRRLVDVRLNNRSQLAGFTKQEDLRYFLKHICAADYRHELLLAPTPDLMDGYRNKTISWEQFEQRFISLLRQRQVELVIDRQLFELPTVLLCSEEKPDHCHRRLVAEYLSTAWGGITITHL